MSNRSEEGTPLLSVPSDTEEIKRFIETLEEALNKHDAEAYNRYFTNDIAWGNPNGGVLLGWEPLHAVHKGFLEGPLRNSNFRYTVHHAKYLTPDIAHVHVQLVRTTADGSVVESNESCLYVLIRRHGAWWVCAGHNTRVQAVWNAE
ncbi:MAG: SgcJ/EcaC family oxidoreductase [Gammaproteobacteria bacterium]